MIHQKVSLTQDKDSNGEIKKQKRYKACRKQIYTMEYYLAIKRNELLLIHKTT